MFPASALLNDLAQRLITLNKRQQRQHLRRWLRELGVGRGARLLDFGCGTGLFAPTLRDAGVDYVGYDPGAGLATFAASRYPSLPFVSSLEAAAATGRFDVVLANCCFHHIGDRELAEDVLPAIAGLLHPEGRLLVIDVLPLDAGASLARRAFNLLEAGDRKRTLAEFLPLFAGRFDVRATAQQRFYVLSVSNPVYNDIIRVELRRR